MLAIFCGGAYVRNLRLRATPMAGSETAECQVDGGCPRRWAWVIESVSLARPDSSGVLPGSFAGEHGGGFAFEVDVGFAADVDGDAFDRAAGEPVRRFTRVVVGDGGSAITADAQAFAGEPEGARLGLDPALADFAVPVVQDSTPVATPGGSSPSLSKEADRIRFSPAGMSSVPSIFSSAMPTKLYT